MNKTISKYQEKKQPLTVKGFADAYILLTHGFRSFTLEEPVRKYWYTALKKKGFTDKDVYRGAEVLTTENNKWFDLVDWIRTSGGERTIRLDEARRRADIERHQEKRQELSSSFEKSKSSKGREYGAMYIKFMNREISFEDFIKWAREKGMNKEADQMVRNHKESIEAKVRRDQAIADEKTRKIAERKEWAKERETAQRELLKKKRERENANT